MDIPIGIILDCTHKTVLIRRNVMPKDGSHIGYSLRDLVFVLTRDLSERFCLAAYLVL